MGASPEAGRGEFDPTLVKFTADRHDPLTGAILAAAVEVHRHLGCGFLEAVYQDALALELGARGVPFTREVGLTILYKGARLRCAYKADFMCHGKVIVETKAITKLTTMEYAQILNYLKATGLELGLLLNFGATRPESRRFIRSNLASAPVGAPVVAPSGQ